MYKTKYKTRDYEAYLDHGCTIVLDKDVLEIDISGNNYGTAIRRRWHDLFLLSYTDERSKRYFLSLHSMNMERTRQFRLYKKAIHPFSKFRNCWDCLILVTTLLNVILFHHHTCVFFSDFSIIVYYINIACELTIFIDLFVNMKTGYVDKETKNIILDSSDIKLNYTSSKLFLHSTSAIPLSSIMLLRYRSNITNGFSKCNKFVCTLKLASIFGLLRLYDASRHWTRERRSFHVTYFFKFARIGVLYLITMMIIMSFVNMLSVLYIIINGELDTRSFFFWLLRYKYYYNPSNIVFVCIEFSRICKALLLFGYGSNQNFSYLDKISSLLAFFVAIIFYMWSILECYSYLSCLHYTDDKFTIAENMAINMLRYRQVPEVITVNVLLYFKFNMSKLLVIEKQNGLYESLPKCLRDEMRLCCYGKYIKKMSFFSSWPLQRIDDIVLMLKMDIHLQSDVVSNMHSEGDGLVILDSGVMAVYSSSNKEVGHLIDGDYFGELSLVTDKEVRISSVVAVTECKVLLLDKAEFRKYMRAYPQLFFDLKIHLKDTYFNEQGSGENVKEDDLINNTTSH